MIDDVTKQTGINQMNSKEKTNENLVGIIRCAKKNSAGSDRLIYLSNENGKRCGARVLKLY